MARRFMYVSIGVLCLVAAYQVGVERARAWEVSEEARNTPPGFASHVFHHICEFPQLDLLLRKREGPDGTRRSFCTVADFPFESAYMYFELLDHPGADELWIVPAVDSLPDAVGGVIRVNAQGTTVTVNESDAVIERHRVAAPDPPWEARLTMAITEDRVVLQDERTGAELYSAQRDSTEFYLAVPSEADTCGGCGFPALDIFLTDEEAKRWQRHLSAE